ncbi:MAG TPA: hypothetical protein VN442_16010 [Bryobacteraceae bacterium]|nr:hypothetical protein [Bryobacteraceae bacterium]
MKRRLVPALAALSIAALFLVFAGPGLRVGFTGDDLMNTYKAWRPPFGEHLRDSVFFWHHSDSFRPVGSIFYRLLFDRYGLNPVPYRIACYVLILLNLWLAYGVLRRVSRSQCVAGLAVLLMAYHGQFWGLYTNTGLCYDLLCFFFYAAAFLYYLRSREHGLPLGWGRVAVWSGLYILALDSKEMAVSLPVVILAYELLDKAPEWRKPLAWVWREGRVPLVGAALTALFIAGRIGAPLGLPSMQAYHPVLSWRIYLNRTYHYLAFALYEPNWLTAPIAYIILISMVVAALKWRSLPFRLGVFWTLVGILPVALIPQRGMDAAYVVAPGFALSIAAVLAALAGRARLRHRTTFALTLAALLLIHIKCGRIDFYGLTAPQRQIAAVHDQLRRYAPFPRGSHILFLRDPLPEHTWNSTFLVYLMTRDPDVSVHRVDRLDEQPLPPEPVPFHAVLSWDGNRLLECDASLFRGVSTRDIAARTASAVCGH